MGSNTDAVDLAKDDNSADSRPPRKQYKQLHPPTVEDVMQEEFMNNCGVKTVMAGVLGFGMGAAMGVFFGAMDTSAVGEGVAPAPENQTVRQVFKQMVTGMRQRAWSYAKGFAYFGALYSGSECVIEKARAKHDIYNSMYAGCFTGAFLARRSGVQAMGAGCVACGAFSALIDKYFIDV